MGSVKLLCNLFPSVAENPVSRKQPVIRKVMPEVSQSLRFQWLVSAHRALRHAGREVTHLNLVFVRSAAVDQGVAMGSGNAGYSHIVRSATNSANDVSDLNLSVLGISVVF
jgi:hypothetical protein